MKKTQRLNFRLNTPRFGQFFKRLCFAFPGKDFLLLAYLGQNTPYFTPSRNRLSPFTVLKNRLYPFTTSRKRFLLGKLSILQEDVFLIWKKTNYFTSSKKILFSYTMSRKRLYFSSSWRIFLLIIIYIQMAL